jgi:hypothetical protein
LEELTICVTVAEGFIDMSIRLRPQPDGANGSSASLGTKVALQALPKLWNFICFREKPLRCTLTTRD